MKIIPPNGYQAAIYLRLSKDEEKSQESNSIINQRRILIEYAEKNGFNVFDEYVDDGVSGVTFKRPGFVKMMDDIEAGKVNMIIVKDLSRLGRNHTRVGQYIEEIFPDLGVRFIAVNDGFDSFYEDEPSADMIPILNFFNEFHAKQTSKKTRASKESMAKSGMFIGSKAPFGYIIDPDNKHHLLIDPDAAETVQLIFQMACDGLGYKAITRRLLEAKILNPTAYNNVKFPTFHKSEYWRQDHDWHPSSVKTILTNPVYLGKTVSGRRRTKSFKNKQILRMPEESWIVVDNMHEALITQNVWDRAQEQIKIRKRVDNQGSIQIFAGLVKCADCGYSLAYHHNKVSGRYQCQLYNTKGKGYCASHSIMYSDLYEAVITDIRRRAKVAAGLDEQFMRRIKNETSGLFGKKMKKAQHECEKIAQKIEELDTIITKLYEDHALGNLTHTRFQSMMKQFEAEQENYSSKYDSLLESLEEQHSLHDEAVEFQNLLSEYKDVPSLDAPMLNKLISRIEVGPKQNIDGIKSQSIRIQYRHFCYVELFPYDEATSEIYKKHEKDFNEIDRALDKQYKEWTEQEEKSGNWPIKYRAQRENGVQKTPSVNNA